MGPLVVVSGKGGVGKSAVTAALALAAHRSGRRVLALSMTGDGDGLAAHLGSGPLEFAPTEVRPGLFALSIDRSRALIEYLQVQVGLPAFAALGPVARAFDVLASTAPAVREIVTIGKVVYEVRRNTWDLVVADGPPTGQIGSYLRAMRTISELVPTGRIRDQAHWMENILETQTTLLLLSIPEELPVSETKESLTWLRSENLVRTIQLYNNRVLPILDTDRANLPAGKAGEAARLHLALQDEQARWMAELPTDRTLPFLFGVVTASEVAARLSDCLEDVP
jgi:anion-transporting  ArsA/GET3 family ATPase